MAALLTVETILIATKERIKDKAAWFGGDNPQTIARYGEPWQTCVYMASTDVLGHYDAFALSNAVDKVLFDALPKTAQRGPFHSDGGAFIAYNDSHTHKAVLRWLDRAIKAAANV